MGLGYDIGRSVAVQPDGKILLSGTCSVSLSSYAFCLARYNANGSLDNTFGNSGTIISPTGQAGGFDHQNWRLALQPDGKIVASGSCRDGNEIDFCVARYNISGSLDTNFGIGGRVITSLTADVDTAYDMAIQADGKILMGGTCSSRMCLVRYNADGSLDLSFQGTGKVIASIDLPLEGSGHGIALQPDGKIILGGRCFAGGLNLFCAARFNTDGSLDTSFNGTGSVVTVTESSSAETYRTALQADGKILLAGTCTLDGDFFSYRFCVIRYNPDGSVDNSFNNGKQLLTMIGTTNSIATVIALQRDGKIILAGQCSSGQQHAACLARYQGGPFGYQNCKPDLDGDGTFVATIDALINMRIALGITGPAVVSGITFPPTATRNTWPLIRDYLVTQCGMSLVQ